MFALKHWPGEVFVFKTKPWNYLITDLNGN